MDSLLRSLAKEHQPLEARNQTDVASSQKETEPMKTSLTIESVSCTPSTPVPNNQVIGATALPPRTPIPPESLKCNILKAKALEQGKNSNLVSISTAETPTPIVAAAAAVAAAAVNDKTQHSADAATIVSVVCSKVCPLFTVDFVAIEIYMSFFFRYHN